MSWRAVLVALAVGAGLGWLAWGGAPPGGSWLDRPAAGAEPAVRFAEIESIRLVREAGGGEQVARLHRLDGGSWRVTIDGRSDPADEAEAVALRRAAASLSPEPASGSIGAGARRVWIGRADAEPLMLRIGGPASPGRVLAEIGGRAVTIDADAARRLSYDGLSRLRSRELVRLRRGAIRRARLETERGAAELRRTPGGWQLADEGLAGARVVQSRVERLLAGLSSAEVGVFGAEASRGGDPGPGWDVLLRVEGEGGAETLRFDVDDADASGRVLASVTRDGRTELVRTALGWFEGTPAGALGFVEARPVPWAAGETGAVRLVDPGGVELVAYERTLDGWVDGLGDPLPESGAERVEALLGALTGAAGLERAAGGTEPGLVIEVDRLGGTGSVRLGVVDAGVVSGGVRYGVGLPGWVSGGGGG